MSLEPADFLEFLKEPSPESIGAFVAKHDDRVKLCECCRGHGVIPKQIWEMNGASNSPFQYPFFPNNASK